MSSGRRRGLRRLIGALGRGALGALETTLLDRSPNPQGAEERSVKEEAYRHLRIRKIVEETPEAKSFYIEELDGTEPEFTAGQYLTLEVYIEGRVYRRAYSLMSPALPNAPRAFTVERVPSGKVSNHLLEFYEEGMLIRARGPSGDFRVEVGEERLGKGNIGELRFFASGNGITPIISLIETLLHQRDYPIRLHYHHREGTPALFEERIRELQSAHMERFKVEALENLDASNIDALLERDALDRPLIFLCGSRAFREAIAEALERKRILPSRIIEERFESPPTLALVELPPEPQRVTLKIGDKAHELQVTQGTTLLDAAIDGGAPLGHRCMIGDCGSCAVRVKRGEAWSATHDALTKREREKGIILACVSHPLSEMELEEP